MWISDLALVDFRSHHEVVLRLEPGVTNLLGPNGVGKTNLVEAIGYLASLSSHRVAADLPLVREGCSRALVKAKVVRGDRAIQIALEIKPSGANHAWLGRNPVGRLADVLGLVQAVVFAPEDLSLVKGGPDGRRDFMDWLLVQRRPAMIGVLRDCAKVIRQRGALLKSIGQLPASNRTSAQYTLEIFNEKLAELGALVTVQRAGLIHDLSRHLETLYSAFAPASDLVSAVYQPSVALEGWPSQSQVQVMLAEQIKQVGEKEIQRGINLVGPQRDELALAIHGRPARGYASHGEAWSLALALRLASLELLKELGFGDPILILDDVFAELDATRRGRLVDLACQVEQVIITAAVEQDVPAALSGTRYWLGRDGIRQEG
ncbi:MAG: DNA replication/repair protein RecF [Micrococcales bacterium]|nr:DNA replication/repair protein RecF [Micrococcales bacterium]